MKTPQRNPNQRETKKFFRRPAKKEERLPSKPAPGDLELIATTLFGLEEVLAAELLKLGAKNIQTFNRAVNFTGDLGFVYKANLCLRTALKVLRPIARFKAYNEDSFYKGIFAISWEKYFDVSKSFAIDVTLNTDHFNHSLFMAQKAKDAICDQFRDNFGKRPDVDTYQPDIRIQIHIFRDQVTVSLDASGELLYKRGYRTDTNVAPLNEVLAAGMILLSGWDKRTPFYDPMTGSGTLAIEAAMFAANIPPGIFREQFSFMHWNNFEQDLYNTILDSCMNRITDENMPPIYALDISANNLKKAKGNMRNAKLLDKIQARVGDFFEEMPETKRGLMILNPPYGERMDKDNTEGFYKQIGDKLKKDYAGFSCWIISSNKEALKCIGLHPGRKITLYNGALECKYQRFDMYEGSKKEKYQKE